MENRIENAAKLARIPEELRSKHKGFSQWDSYSSQRDHDTILQVCYYYLINSKDQCVILFFSGQHIKFEHM